MNQLEITRREFLAKEVLRYLIANPRSGIFTPAPKAERTARLYATGKPWQQSGAKMHQQKTVPEITEVTLSELLTLSDGELLELHKKVENAIKVKRIQTRQSRYFLK